MIWRRFLHSEGFVFFNDTATTEIYTLSLHDALPISGGSPPWGSPSTRRGAARTRNASGARIERDRPHRRDRKSTRLNSSHANISYAVFCLKKKYSILFKALVFLSFFLLFLLYVRHFE